MTLVPITPRRCYVCDRWVGENQAERFKLVSDPERGESGDTLWMCDSCVQEAEASHKFDSPLALLLWPSCACDSGPLIDVEHDAGCRRCGFPVRWAVAAPRHEGAQPGATTMEAKGADMASITAQDVEGVLTEEGLRWTCDAIDETEDGGVVLWRGVGFPAASLDEALGLARGWAAEESA